MAVGREPCILRTLEEVASGPMSHTLLRGRLNLVYHARVYVI